MLSFFPQGVLDEILNLIESVSEGFPSYSITYPVSMTDPVNLFHFSTGKCLLRGILIVKSLQDFKNIQKRSLSQNGKHDSYLKTRF